MSLALTGTTGFIGKKIFERINSIEESQIIKISRDYYDFSEKVNLSALNQTKTIGLLDVLKNQKTLIHAAGIAHTFNPDSNYGLSELRRVNVDSTLNLARHAAAAGVSRFIFISSIGVNGNKNSEPFTEDDIPKPQNDYARSKLEAEQGLWEIQKLTGMELVIIRPPLVYGPRPPGNFASLIKVIKKGYPLPLGSITSNKRSLIALDNLVDFIILCSNHIKTPQAANQTFVISDGEDVSTVELLSKVAAAYGQKGNLIPFPPYLLRLAANVFCKQAIAERLLDSLRVDSTKARRLLGWKPSVTMDEQLQKMAKDEECLR